MFNFENASLLSYNHISEFFGDNVLRYKITKDLSIQGWILDFANTSGEGISGVWSGIRGMINDAVDYDDIIINGVAFGKGKVDSLVFAENKDVRIKNYTATLKIWDTGNLFNATGDMYSGIDFTSYKLIDTLSESFSFDKNEADHSSYRHSVALRLNSGVAVQPIPLAKLIAQNLYNKTNLTGFLGVYTGYNIKKYYTENYNLITNECSFEESVEFDQISGNYSITFTHSINTSEDGNTTVAERGTIKGLVLPLIGAAQSGLNTEKPLIFPRCSGVFEAYKPDSGASPLREYPISQGLTINSFDGTIGYDFTFSNDQRYLSGFAWSYTQRLERSEEGIYEVTEEGNIFGFGRKLVEKYPNAVSGYNIVKAGIGSRISGLYASNVTPILPLTLISKTEGRSAFNGTVDYAQTYTDDQTLSGASGIKKIELTVNDSDPVHLTSKYNIVNVKELVQPAGIATVGKRELNINMIGSRGTDLPIYLAVAKTKAGEFVPNAKGGDVYLESCSYNWNKNENDFQLSASWNFFTGRKFDNFLV